MEIAPFSVETPGAGAHEPLAPNFAGAWALASHAQHEARWFIHVQAQRALWGEETQ